MANLKAGRQRGNNGCVHAVRPDGTASKRRLCSLLLTSSEMPAMETRLPGRHCLFAKSAHSLRFNGAHKEKAFAKDMEPHRRCGSTVNRKRSRLYKTEWNTSPKGTLRSMGRTIISMPFGSASTTDRRIGQTNRSTGGYDSAAETSRAMN